MGVMGWARLRHCTPSEALQLAKDECARRSLPWIEPVSMTGGLVQYHIMTNASKRGGNVNIAIWAWGSRVAFVRVGSR